MGNVMRFNSHYFVCNAYLNLMQFLCRSYMLEFPIYVLCIAKCIHAMIELEKRSGKEMYVPISLYIRVVNPSLHLSLCLCLFGLFFNFNVYLFISFSSRCGHCKKLAPEVISLSKLECLNTILFRILDSFLGGNLVFVHLVDHTNNLLL